MMKTRCSSVLAPVVASVLASGVSTSAVADFYGVQQHGYWVTAEDFGGVEVTAYVVDVYLLCDDPFGGSSGDMLLNVYNWNYEICSVCPLTECFFQSFTSTGWLAQNAGGVFDTEALQRADSFVTIGGFGSDARQRPGAGAGTGLDPDFGGNSASVPGPNAGWYNGSPPSYNGGCMVYDNGITGVLIGRFSSTEGAFSLSLTVEATWNQGLGTPGVQGQFVSFCFAGSPDCDGDGISDCVEIGDGAPDCNGNLIPDGCDIADGMSTDCDLNGIPDECDIAGGVGDCDGDSVLDACEIADGAPDCDGNGIPDECQDQPDCDGDGILDACEIADGAPDCNGNGIPDTCDLADGTSTDYDADGLPDDCEGGVVGTDYATIAEGLLAAPDGGVIVVPSGTWTEPFAFDRAVTIIAPDGPETTTLSNGGAPQTIVTAHGAPSGAALVGFTITNGVGIAGQAGGGIDAIDSFLRVEDCILRGNFGVDGGGARFQGGAPTIRGCTFRDNTSQGAGGGLRLVASDATVESCLFEMNLAATDTLGWALAVTDGLTLLRDLEATAHQGQAVHFDATAGYPATTAGIERVFIHDNDLGPGVDFDGDDPQLWTLADSRICGNGPGSEMDRAILGAYTDLGANILFADGCPDLVVPDDADTIQLAIDTALDGERIAVRPGTYDEGGLDMTGRDLELVGVEDLFEAKPSVTGPIDGSGMPASGLIRGLVIENGFGVTTVPGYEGLRVGGGLVLDGSSATVERCQVEGNHADLGGGIFIRGTVGSPVLRTVSIASNAAALAGGGVHLEGDAASTITLEDCLVTANIVPTDGTARGGGVDARGLEDAASLVLVETSVANNTRENLALDPTAGSITDLGGNAITEAEDCDGNGIEDIADLLEFGGDDCNGNFTPDSCDLARGTSADCDGDGTLDDCQLGYEHPIRYAAHDREADNGFGTGVPGTLAWLQRFTAAPGLTAIAEVGVEFALPWSGNAYNGLPVTVGVWSDPDGDGRPHDAVPLALVEILIEGAPAADRQFATLPDPVSLSPGESFFIGAIMDRPEGPYYPASADTSGGSTESWFAFDESFFAADEIGTASEIGTLPSLGLNWRWTITGVPAYEERTGDCNANGVVDTCETADGSEADCDGNGVPDICDLANGAPDLDQDGILDACQDQLVFLVPDRFSSIGSAIAAATDGSRIQLSAAGSPYVERVDFGTRNLELIGDPADPASVVVEAFGLDSTVITIAGGQDSSTRIAGILVKQGIADTPEPGSPTNLVGGGFYIDGSDPVIEDCIIADNRAARGGGAYLRFSEAVFRRTTIQANAATGDGAGLWWSEGTVRLEDCDVLDNFAEGNGGGLRATAEDGTIIGGSIAGNLATNDGAGLWWQGSTQALAIDGVVITGNIAGEVGGGIKTRYGYPGVTLANSTLCDNAPDELDGVYTDLGGNDLCLCPADLNGDGEVGGEDLGLYLAYSGSECEPFTPCPGDVNNDGVLSGADIGQILGGWGLCP